MSDICESCKYDFKVIKRWFPFDFAKILQGRHFVLGAPKNFKLLRDIFLIAAFKIFY